MSGRLWTGVLAAAVVVLSLVLTSCVELLGQRLVLWHDVANDRVVILLFYDGVHEAAGQGGDGTDQIPEFVANGDVMFLDWYMHLQRSEFEEAVADAKTPPAVKAVAQAYLDDVRTQALGHYRDPLGQIGAGQLIVIEHVTDFLAKVNAGLDEAAIAAVKSNNAAFILSVVEGGHQWVALDGSNLVVRIPMPAAEWRAQKASLLRDMLGSIKDDRDKGYEAYAGSLWVLTSFCGYEEQPNQVTFRIGAASAERLTLRAPMRSLAEYNGELEEALAENVPGDLNAELAKVLMEGQAEGPMGSVAKLAPVEMKAAALLQLIQEGEPAEREKALAALEVLVTAHDAAGGLPTAPAAANTADDLAAWRQWYLQVARYPLNEKWPAATQPATGRPTATQPAASQSAGRSG